MYIFDNLSAYVSMVTSSEWRSIIIFFNCLLVVARLKVEILSGVIYREVEKGTGIVGI